MDLAEQRVVSALPQPTCDVAGLERHSAQAILGVANNPSVAWWRRRLCGECLDGRVSEDLVARMWELVLNAEETTEIRISFLRALCSWCVASESDKGSSFRATLLPWLRDSKDSEKHGWQEAVIAARCQLGDPTSAADLAELAYSPWHHHRRTALKALAALRHQCDDEVLLEKFGAASPEELIVHGAIAEARHLGILILDADGKRSSSALLEALSDPEPAVAQLAQSVLRRGDISEETLLALFDRHASLLRDIGITPPTLTGPAAAACRAIAIIAERAAGSSAPWMAYRKPLRVPCIEERPKKPGCCDGPTPRGSCEHA